MIVTFFCAAENYREEIPGELPDSNQGYLSEYKIIYYTDLNFAYFW